MLPYPPYALLKPREESPPIGRPPHSNAAKRKFAFSPQQLAARFVFSSEHCVCRRCDTKVKSGACCALLVVLLATCNSVCVLVRTLQKTKNAFSTKKRKNGGGDSCDEGHLPTFGLSRPFTNAAAHDRILPQKHSENGQQHVSESRSSSKPTAPPPSQSHFCVVLLLPQLQLQE